MTIDAFAADCGLSTLQELDKALHLAFFYLKKGDVTEFGAVDCARWLDSRHLPKPNTSRLADKLRAATETVAGSKPGLFRLHGDYQRKMNARFPALSEKSQDIVDHGTVLPAALYGNTRGFIESLAKQINRSYEENIFDGCAVLMRRLEEVLLILSYEELQIASAIKDSAGNYLMLEAVVKNAVSNPTLSLSRNSKASIETFRKLGNYSAHKITYTCRREYIKEKIDEYRALVDELLHKAGIRT